MDEQIARFLTGRHMATLGTVNPNGSVQLTAVWYVFEAGAVSVMTGSRSRKARNVARTGQASIMVDSHERGPLKGAATSGPAVLLFGDEATPIKERILARYCSSEALADPRVGSVMMELDDCVIRITPGTWAWWDVGAAFAGVLDTPGYLLPLSSSG